MASALIADRLNVFVHKNSEACDVYQTIDAGNVCCYGGKCC
jgi:hypothetical protein